MMNPMRADAPADVFADALALPAKERARLARELLESLEEEADPGAAEAWRTEIERRAREVEDGSVTLNDWDEVRASLTQRLSKP